MKLAALALLATLGLGTSAYAEPLAPAPARGQLRQLLLERFDRNHDGRLEPRERRQAARALRRLARRMEQQERRGQLRDGRARDLARRFDANGDREVGPDDRDQP